MVLGPLHHFLVRVLAPAPVLGRGLPRAAVLLLLLALGAGCGWPASPAFLARSAGAHGTSPLRQPGPPARPGRLALGSSVGVAVEAEAREVADVAGDVAAEFGGRVRRGLPVWRGRLLRARKAGRDGAEKRRRKRIKGLRKVYLRGEELQGTITKLFARSLTVNIGDEDGIVFTDEPGWTVGQQVTAWVERNRHDSRVLKLSLHRPIEPQKFQGRVTKLVQSGFFVDYGAGEDGFVHISRACDGRVDNLKEVASLGQELTVWLIKPRGHQRKAELTCRAPVDLRPFVPLAGKDVWLSGVITGQGVFGFFVRVQPPDDSEPQTGLVKWRHMKTAEERRSTFFSVGQEVRVRVRFADLEPGRLWLSRIPM